MADNAQKTHLAIALDALARGRAVDADQLQGKAFPVEITEIVSSNMVKVKFLVQGGPWSLPEVTVPVDSPAYGRLPHQVGDKGIVSNIDFYQGGVSGLGGGTADYVQRGNLTNLRFMGIGNKTLPDGGGTVDLNAYCVYGKNGAVLFDMDSDGNVHSKIILTPDHLTIDLTNSHSKTVTVVGTTTITFDGDLHVKGAIIAGFGTGDQVGLQTHRHTQPVDSHGDTEAETDPPVAGT